MKLKSFQNSKIGGVKATRQLMQYQIELPRSTTTLSQDANNIQPVLSQKSYPLERR